MGLRRLPTYIIFIIIAACAGGSLHAQAQGRGQGGVYRNPLAVPLERMVRRTFPDYFKGRPEIVPDGFYPIGWSKDGKFAYYTEPVDEACDCYFAKLFILDLKTDKVLWSFDYDSETIEEAQKEKRPYSFNTLWKQKRELFNGKLKEHGIVPQGRFALLPFPIRQDGEQLAATVKLREKAGMEDDMRIYGDIDRATLMLTSRRSGQKVVLERDYPEGMPLDVKALGYIKSPFEQRVALIFIEVYRGYEGPPHVGQVNVAGASLTTGFK